jgi:hypothetical protein
VAPVMSISGAIALVVADRVFERINLGQLMLGSRLIERPGDPPEPRV